MAWNRKDTCPYEQVADSYEFANYVFHMVMLPFLITIYSLSIAVIDNSLSLNPEFSADDFHLVVLILNLVSSIIGIAVVAIKDIKKIQNYTNLFPTSLFRCNFSDGWLHY